MENQSQPTRYFASPMTRPSMDAGRWKKAATGSARLLRKRDRLVQIELRLLFAVTVAAAFSLAVYAISNFFGEQNVTGRAFLTVGFGINVGLLTYAVISNGDRIFLITVCIYNTLFLLLPAIFQSAAQRFPFFSVGYNQSTVTICALIVIVFSVCFATAYFFVRERGQGIDKTLRTVPMSASRSTLLVFVLMGLSLIAFFYLGASYYTGRRGDVDFDTSPIGMMVPALGRAASFFAVALAIILTADRRRKRYAMLSIVAIAVFFLLNNPINMSRAYFLGPVIALGLIFFNTRSLTAKIVVCLIFLVGVTTIFPFLSNVSRGDPGAPLLEDPIIYYTTSGDFDGFQSIMNVFLMVSAKGVSYGAHLLSDIFFFVPRTSWPTKAMGTGGEAAIYSGYPWTNVSAPLPAEFLVDFGWIGVIFGAGAVGYLCARLERVIERAIRTNSKLDRLVPAIAASYVPIVMRGSLLGIIGPVALGIVMGFILRYLCKESQPADGGSRPLLRLAPSTGGMR